LRLSGQSTTLIRSRLTRSGRSSGFMPSVPKGWSRDGPAGAPGSATIGRILEDHPVAIQTAAEEFVGGAPEIQTKSPVVPLAELLNDGLAVGLEIGRPLTEGQEIAPSVVVQLVQAQWRAGHLCQEIVQHQEGMIAPVDVLHHEGGQLVFLGAGTAV